jgi:hypothetical protein
MASIQFNLTEFKNEKPKERLVIPSSVASRIGSPLENFVEVPNSKDLGLSFIETRSELITPNNLFSPSYSQNSVKPQNELLFELDIIKERIREINQKLEQNLGVLKKTEDSPFSASEIVKSRIFEMKGKKKIRCTCTKDCEIF